MLMTKKLPKTVSLPLTNGGAVIVDSADLPIVGRYKWYGIESNGTTYAQANIKVPVGRTGYKWTTLKLHRVLFPESEVVDHIDGNGLNDSRSNLRPASRGENSRNRKHFSKRTPYKGVSWKADVGKWCARINAQGRVIHLGYFGDAAEAARAYNRASLKMHGKFSRINRTVGS